MVGEIVKTHGIKGNVKIISYCDNPFSIFDYEPIILENIEHKIFLDLNYKNNRFSKKLFVVEIPFSKLKETSKKLIGKKLLANKKEFHACEHDDFFYSDLEGCDVLNYDSKIIGKISGIFNFGAGDILEITKLNDESTILVNFNKNNFPKVSIEEKKIITNFKVDEI